MAAVATVLLLLILLPLSAPLAEDVGGIEPSETLQTLISFVDLRDTLIKDIEALKRQLAAAASEAEKDELRRQLEKLEGDLSGVNRNFANLAAGVDISDLQEKAVEEFNLQKELFSLLKPAIDEMKDMTSRVRQKSDLKDKIAFFELRIPILQEALKNVEALLAQNTDEATEIRLQAIADSWKKQLDLMQSELQGSQLQLEKLVAAETTLVEASQSYLKSFFQKRGFYLTIALSVVIAIVLLSRLTHRVMQRYLPGFRKPHRSFRTRLAELIHRVISILLVILGPMVVFYAVEDWVLFSLGILLLLGLGLALRHAVPRYWHQVQIFLNIGSVREGERVFLDGLPWQVKQINLFSTLVNPIADLTLRIPISDLVDIKSRVAKPDEPWFPCRKGDWVILSDGVRGKVTGISVEMIQLVERGGATLTYNTPDFLAKSPRNLATNFRLKETIGITYELQRDATEAIPELLHRYVTRRIEEEGYGDKLLNLRVEFAQANNSSLDLVVIADFSGELGDLYNRLRRAIQRWCVDACTEYGWEIPFTQLTLHGAGGNNV